MEMNAQDNKAKNLSTMTILEEKVCPPIEASKELKDVDYTVIKPWEKATQNPSLISKGSELFVGNLSIETIEEDLFNIFKSYGEVIDIRILKNVQTKKCYAFVRFLTKEMTHSALELNLTTVKGRQIKVTKSNENSTIFIGNIRKTWTNSEVETKVRRIFHNVQRIDHFTDPKSNDKNRGFCFAVFNKRNEAIKALNYVQSKGGINIDGIPLTCDWADVVDDDEESHSKQICIKGLNECIEESILKDLFKAYGSITNVALCKNHLNSKRKDLAFITYETHNEALRAIEVFNQETELKESLGTNVTASIAFSQQTMQAKKKIKDSRKKINQIIHPGNPIQPQLNISQEQSNITQGPNVIGEANNPNVKTLMTMINILNMNKYPNLFSQNMISQFMTACLGNALTTSPNEVQTQHTAVKNVPTSYGPQYYSNQVLQEHGYVKPETPTLPLAPIPFIGNLQQNHNHNNTYFLNNKRNRQYPCSYINNKRDYYPSSYIPNQPQSSDLSSKNIPSYSSLNDKK